MKNLLVLIVITLTLASCIKRNPDDSLLLRDNKSNPDKLGADNPYVEVIDSCEYIIWGNKMAHKGNCKFCAARRDIVPGPPVEDYVEDEGYHSLSERF